MKRKQIHLRKLLQMVENRLDHVIGLFLWWLKQSKVLHKTGQKVTQMSDFILSDIQAKCGKLMIAYLDF